ncbi:MAG: hypothetical protein ABI905_02935 [Betaproteobacteria bacterium]
MNKLLMVSIAAAVSGMSGLAAAQEVGKVISSTPVTREVAFPQKQCAPDANSRDACRSATTYETRTIGYKVVYEYAGKQHEVQLPFPPGATIELDVTPAGQAMQSQPYSGTATQLSPDVPVERVYVDRVERVYREPVYVDDTAYYPARPYYPGYYASPVYPLLGVALGYSWGYGRGWHGGGGYGWGHHRR